MGLVSLCFVSILGLAWWILPESELRAQTSFSRAVKCMMLRLENSASAVNLEMFGVASMKLIFYLPVCVEVDNLAFVSCACLSIRS